MIVGSHSIIYSRNAEKDRAFFRDTLKLPSIDAGGGWLIFGLPPSEAAFHPGFSGKHEFYLICEDIAPFVAAMAKAGLRCSAPKDQGWGILTELTLPSGTRIGVYEPRHPRPSAAKAPTKKVRKKAPPPRKAAKRTAVAKTDATKKAPAKAKAKKKARRK